MSKIKLKIEVVILKYRRSNIFLYSIYNLDFVIKGYYYFLYLKKIDWFKNLIKVEFSFI